LYILDTDHITLAQQKHPRITQNIAMMPKTMIATTIITVQEQLSGRLNAINRANSKETLVRAYLNLQANILYFSPMQILPFNEMAYDHFTELRKQGLRIGTQDLRIACIALAFGGIIVTRNSRDFEKVPQLQLLDWS